MWKNTRDNAVEIDNKNNLMNKYMMNYSRVFLNEKKFVMETEF
jgi:hypothetical protein